MSHPTPVTEHVTQCVKLLNEWLQNNPTEDTQGADRSNAFEAVFELIAVPWDVISDDDQEWREGYETALLDVVDHIAQAWGVDLPPFRPAAKEG